MIFKRSADEPAKRDQEGRCVEQQFRDVGRVAQGVEDVEDVDAEALSPIYRRWKLSGTSKRMVLVRRTMAHVRTAGRQDRAITNLPLLTASRVKGAQSPLKRSGILSVGRKPSAI